MPVAARKAESAPVRHRGRACTGPGNGEQFLDNGGGGECLHWRTVQDGPGVDRESLVSGPTSADQVGDVGLDALDVLAGKRSPFDGEDAAVRDGGFFRAAPDQGGVQVAWPEEWMGPVTKLLVERVVGDEEVAGGEDGVGAEVRS